MGIYAFIGLRDWGWGFKVLGVGFGVSKPSDIHNPCCI